MLGRAELGKQMTTILLVKAQIPKQKNVMKIVSKIKVHNLCMYHIQKSGPYNWNVNWGGVCSYIQVLPNRFLFKFVNLNLI